MSPAGRQPTVAAANPSPDCNAIRLQRDPTATRPDCNAHVSEGILGLRQHMQHALRHAHPNPERPRDLPLANALCGQCPDSLLDVLAVSSRAKSRRSTLRRIAAVLPYLSEKRS